jgi:hypothetical protein
MAENSRREAARENREGGSAAGGEQQRDARGRFGAGGGGPNDDKEGGDSKSLTLAILKAAAQGGAAALGSTEKVDPAIESAQEIHGMVSGAVSALKTTGKLGIAVAGRAFGSAKEKDVPWYRKLLQQLKLMRRDDGEFHRAELRALNNRAGGGGGGGGGGSALPDWVPKLPGAVPKLLGAGAKLLGKLALPAAAIGSAIKSFGTNTSDYADRLGTKDDGGIAKSLGIRAAGVLGDLGSTLTLGLADKLGKSETLGKVIEKSVSGLSAAKDWALGKTSQLFESGRKGAGTISTGKGDNGGVSYGTYQMSTTKGVAGDFVKGSKYAKDFEGLKPGTPEFSAKWKEVAAADPSFGQAQHDYIQKTKYEPQQQKLKDSGIDLSKRGAAVQDAIWSTSVQFGGNTSLIQGALKGRDAAKMSDAEIVTAIQDYKLKNNDALFKSSSPDVRASTAKRAQNEKVDLLKLAEGASPVAPPTGLGITSSPAPSIPLPTAGATVPASLAAPASIRPPPVSVAPAPPPAASPELHVPLTSKGPLEVTVRNDQLANQDVKDRRLAQIATGGVSGA